MVPPIFLKIITGKTSPNLIELIGLEPSMEVIKPQFLTKLSKMGLVRVILRVHLFLDSQPRTLPKTHLIAAVLRVSSNKSWSTVKAESQLDN